MSYWACTFVVYRLVCLFFHLVTLQRLTNTRQKFNKCAGLLYNYQPIFLVSILKLHLFQCRKQTKLKMFESCLCSMDWIILGPFLPFDCTNVIRYRSDMYYKNVKFHDDQHILILQNSTSTLAMLPIRQSPISIIFSWAQPIDKTLVNVEMT